MEPNFTARQAESLGHQGKLMQVFTTDAMPLISRGSNCLHRYVPDALQALARACVPDGPPQQRIPAAIKEVSATLTTRLLQLIVADAENQPDVALDAAAIRLAAASAVLRLARSHDSSLDVKAYQTLALVIQASVHPNLCKRPKHAMDSKTTSISPCTMQDPVVEVRREYARKVSRLVVVLQVMCAFSP